MVDQSSSANSLDAVSEVLAGSRVDWVVSHGRSQYSGFGGVSACGLAAMNCARLVLLKERDRLAGVDLLEELTEEQTMDDVLGICSSWESTSHLDVDEIAHAPIFHRSLMTLSTDFGESSPGVFSRLLSRLKEFSLAYDRSSCVVMTRPPEIIACFYIPCPPTSEAYVIFDSHPRPDLHPDGAAFIFNSTAEATTDYLANLLRYDHSLLAERNIQWEARLLSEVSGHFFVAQNRPRDPAEHWTSATMESSLKGLALRAEVEDLKSQNSTLTAQLVRLQNTIDRLEHAAQANSVWREAKSAYPTLRPRSIRPPRKENLVSSIFQQGSSTLAAAASRLYAPTYLPFTAQSSSGSARDPMREPSSRQLEAAPARPKGKSPEPVGKGEDRAVDKPADRSPRPQTDSADAAANNQDTTDDDLAFALTQQRLYDEEHQYLIMERGRLSQTTAFKCQICMDKHSQEDVAAVDGCGHQFCRDCMRTYASNQLSEHLYPIFCPLCSVEKDDKEPTVLSNALMQQIGLSEQEFATFVELEMASFSILVHCRSCQNSFFVVREELNEVDVIDCPLPRCGKSWCKMCSQLLDRPGAVHSCDGTAELRLLMGQRGWKYCPGCQTPAEKIDGCNHVKCTSPGCKTHFCYLCGATIVASIVPTEIERAVNQHYQTCQMFEEVPDHGVPP